jgi:hypothetical protein
MFCCLFNLLLLLVVVAVLVVMVVAVVQVVIGHRLAVNRLVVVGLPNLRFLFLRELTTR